MPATSPNTGSSGSAALPVELDVASEFRYREAPLRKGDLAIFISQSGETADTLAALRYAKEQGVHTLSVVNVPTSTIARESETVLPTLAGPEIGVASTKAFTCQLMVLAAIAVAAGKARGELSDADETKLVHGLVEIPRLMAAALATEPQIEKLAREIAKCKDVLYLGRGTSYPLALEGALKLKEISYIHAEGYAAGELKHGPIALIDENMPVVVIAPYDRVFEKTVSNMQEVAARGGKIILMTDAKGAAEATIESLVTIVLPDMAATFTPLVYAVPVQLLAYHTAVVMGTDVDQPRNLAKSVTVGISPSHGFPAGGSAACQSLLGWLQSARSRQSSRLRPTWNPNESRRFAADRAPGRTPAGGPQRAYGPIPELFPDRPDRRRSGRDHLLSDLVVRDLGRRHRPAVRARWPTGRKPICRSGCRAPG